MYTLQKLLVSLGGQKLLAGYLTPTSPTAYQCAVDMIMNFNGTLMSTNPVTPPTILNTPAWVSSLRGSNAIYLDDASGNLSTANGPAYIFG